MNIIKIVPKNTFTCITISAFTSYFGNCDYSLLSPNRLVPVPFIFGQAEKSQLDFCPPFKILLKKQLNNSLHLTKFIHRMLFIPNYFSSDTDFHLDQQLKMLCSFNEHVPCNPQGEYAENNFKTILQSLKTTKISESLKDSFNDDDLEKWEKYAQREFDEMGRINRLRLKNMVELADKEMLQAIFEIMLILDINPLNLSLKHIKCKCSHNRTSFFI